MKGDSPVKARLLVISLATAALVALPSGALGSASHAATNSQSFPDSTGEDANAPDVTGIDVANDDAGLITFHIKISNRPALTPDMVIVMWMDTDGNLSTGDLDFGGADYSIELDPGSVGLFKWNGTTYDPAQSQTSVTYNYDATGATITASAADLGGARVVNFVVAAVSGITIDPQGNPDFTTAHIDFAPDSGHGLYKYNVIAKLTLTATAFTTAPKPAKAGKKLTASVAVNESDTNGPVTSATVACVGTIKGVRVAATHTLTNGIASCSWKLPAKSKGKTFLGKISVTVRGTTLTKSFSARIT
jgi:hypothetical protein